MKEKVKQLFEESLVVKGFTNTKTEQEIERFLIDKISGIPYFSEHRDLYGEYKIGDFHDRSVVWALKKGAHRETVIIFHHHDVVDISDYGKFESIAFDNEALKKAYLSEAGIAENVKKDATSADWYFGRGSADMKAALALQLFVLDEYSKENDPKVNLLFISVAGEESYSDGMRKTPELLKKLKEEHDLNYILAIDGEPFEGDKDDEKILHIGTVGKLMPVIVAQGVVSHIKEPLEGLNAISLMAKISDKIDLNPELADVSKGEQSPLPSWSYTRDLKEIYDVSTVLRSAGYFSILYLEKSPEKLMERVRELALEATDEYYEKWLGLQKKYGVKTEIKRPKALLYDELLDLCREKEGFEQTVQRINEEAILAFKNGKGFQDITIATIEKMLDFYGEKEAVTVIALAPPYYPALSSSNIPVRGAIIPKLKEHYEAYLSERGLELKTEEYFMGICDISYCGLEQDANVHKAVLRKTAIEPSLYDLDFDVIQEINVPAVNLGPWGKDLHRYTERVYEPDSFELVPNYLLYLLNNIHEIM